MIAASSGSPRRVYPRECGGTPLGAALVGKSGGLSPRVRGNRRRIRGRPDPPRSIPASAGEPRSARVRVRRQGVYPRECGGTGRPPGYRGGSEGLSPRVRGNLTSAASAGRARRSIPASAGEPHPAAVVAVGHKVYPRECGGTSSRTSPLSPTWGLSPRVRGNPRLVSGHEYPDGSIPASAGEPRSTSSTRRRWRVYPRECGGTAGASRGVMPASGLSPRVRGNRVHLDRVTEEEGSIPASAGEPRAPARRSRGTRVYPRECGGTSLESSPSSSREGLSPRVRGNRSRRGDQDGDVRSIPASAGEPHHRRTRQQHRAVYPRECGGTRAETSRGTASRGLSPRVRGNLPAPVRVRVYQGSIPASAGEPTPGGRSPTVAMVYPRECGGTDPDGQAAFDREGLSPRVRGNRAPHRVRPAGPGSIPASAGEPGD